MLTEIYAVMLMKSCVCKKEERERERETDRQRDRDLERDIDEDRQKETDLLTHTKFSVSQ